MAAPRRAGRPKQTRAAATRRFTVDASVFVNAFNPHETGQVASLAFLTAILQRGDPIIVPALLLVEIASAISRASAAPASADHSMSVPVGARFPERPVAPGRRIDHRDRDLKRRY